MGKFPISVRVHIQKAILIDLTGLFNFNDEVQSTRYNSPATKIPPHAYCSFSESGIFAKIPVSRLAMLANPPKNANDDPRNAGILNFAHKWKNSVPRPAQNNVTCTEST